MRRPTIDERQLAIEAAFNALLVTLHQAGLLPADQLRQHLALAADDLEQRDPETFRGTVAALDEMRQHLDVLLPPAAAVQAGR